MKRLILSLILLVSAGYSNAQQLTNSGLENWTNLLIYYSPNNWGHTNILVPLGNPVMIKRSTDKRSGNYSAQLETKVLLSNPSPDTLPDTLPGTIFTGIATLTSQVFGIPYTYRIGKLSFWYKYAPVGTDTAGAYVGLFKFNASLGQKDTVADGFVTIYGTNTSWMLAEVDLIYRMPDNPDTLGVLFGSGIPGQAIPGSILKIDDISISMPTGLSMEFPSEKLVDIYPQPAHNRVNIQSNSFDLSRTKLEIFDLNSRLVKSIKPDAGRTEVDISDLLPAMYFVTITDEQGRRLYSSKIIKVSP